MWGRIEWCEYSLFNFFSSSSLMYSASLSLFLSLQLLRLDASNNSLAALPPSFSALSTLQICNLGNSISITILCSLSRWLAPAPLLISQWFLYSNISIKCLRSDHNNIVLTENVLLNLTSLQQLNLKVGVSLVHYRTHMIFILYSTASDFWQYFDFCTSSLYCI